MNDTLKKAGLDHLSVMLPDILNEEAEKKIRDFQAACENAGISMAAFSVTVDVIRKVFCWSDFIAGTCIRQPDMFLDLIRNGALSRPYRPGEFSQKLGLLIQRANDESDLYRELRRFRNREMIRIAWQDLVGWADLNQIMLMLSELADACIEHGLSFIYNQLCTQMGIPCSRDGKAQQLVVIAMGKLGAGELNFSSDVDLIFAYPETGNTRSRPDDNSFHAVSESPLQSASEKSFKTVTNDEFFTRLCRQLIKALNQHTADGFVFRVDMGLRPFGESGPVVMSFDAMERYYQEQGREWERYAWIKARVCAGDHSGGRRFLKRMTPFVFRKYLDYGVFESLRDMKQKIAHEVHRKGMKHNVKLGPGGIREIEFFGQIFQLIRGGVIPQLQNPSISLTLGMLAEHRLIPESVRDELLDAYQFLRKTENRLQEYGDLQTHKIPSGSLEKARLASALGFLSADEFFYQLQFHMNKVHRHFENLLESEDSQSKNKSLETEMTQVWMELGDNEKYAGILNNAGFQDVQTVYKLLADLREDTATRALSREGRKRLDKLMPLVLEAVSKSPDPQTALSRMVDLIKSIERRTCYISLLLEKPDALKPLISLSVSSSWIISFIARHPVLLDEMLDQRTLFSPPTRDELEDEIIRRLNRLGEDDLEGRMEELSIFKQVNVLRVAAADITEALPLMKVSDHLSDIAETVVNQVIALAWQHLEEKHGAPACQIDNTPCEKGFAVIAYGKLGGLELGYGSDLDLVFIHAGTGNLTRNPKNPIDDTYFFARLGQRVVHILTAHTRAGQLYETDMRLRPSGSAGLLVCQINAFEDYQTHKAWIWEKQALVRARIISGDPLLSNRFKTIRNNALTQSIDPDILKNEVTRMRIRMRQSLLKTSPDMFDIKQDHGGIVDIEFLLQYLVLRHAAQYPQLLEWTDNVRIISTLADAGIIDETAAYFLRKAYLIFRAATHRLSLQQQPALLPARQYRDLRNHVIRIIQYHLQICN